MVLSEVVRGEVRVVEGVSTEDDTRAGHRRGEAPDGCHECILEPRAALTLQPLHDAAVATVAGVAEDGDVSRPRRLLL